MSSGSALPALLAPCPVGCLLPPATVLGKLVESLLASWLSLFARLFATSFCSLPALIVALLGCAVAVSYTHLTLPTKA